MTPPASVANKVPIGLLLPLSGPSAALGRSLLDASQLALFEVADKNFVLIPRDTMGTPEGARAAAASAIEDGAKLLLGPVFASSALAVAPLARDPGINMVAFTNNRAAAGDGAFVMGFLPSQRIERVVSYAASRGASRFAAVLPQGPYGDTARDAFLRAVARAGAGVVRIERYVANAKSMAEAAKRLGKYDARRNALFVQRKTLSATDDEVSRRALNRLIHKETLGEVDFDAVLLLETGEAIKGLAPLLPYYDIDIRTVRVLGIDDWSDRSLRREPSLARAWFASPPIDAAAEFMTRFKKIYAQLPHALAPLAYDATALAAVLASREGDANFGVEALTAENGFAGSAGLFRLLRSGLVEHQFAVFEVQQDKIKIVSDAPQSFGVPIN
ncbi:penicillin-binding protein activator [Alphaproteobacteria bacterium]|nr:penicillin-binding protein activator [Alphaproteobacteria bacterium]